MDIAEKLPSVVFGVMLASILFIATTSPSRLDALLGKICPLEIEVQTTSLALDRECNSCPVYPTNMTLADDPCNVYGLDQSIN